MARARWIKPEFYTDKKVSQVSDQAALLFPALWVECDDGGVCPGDPRVIYGRRFITRPGWTIATVEAALAELVAVGLVRTFMHRDEPFIVVPGFADKQGISGSHVKKWRHLDKAHQEVTESVINRTNGNCTTTTSGGSRLPPKPLPSPLPSPSPLPESLVAQSATPPGLSVAVVERRKTTALSVGDVIANLHEVETQTERRLSADARRDVQAQVTFAYWAKKLGHEKTLLDRKRKSVLLARLVENSGNLSELLYAIDGALRDDWLMGRDAKSTKRYDGIETIFRDRAQIERLAATCAKWKAGEVHPMAEKYGTAA